jgi:hypothetical protein
VPRSLGELTTLFASHPDAINPLAAAPVLQSLELGGILRQHGRLVLTRLMTRRCLQR